MSSEEKKEALWYVVHTQSGQEKKVKETLEMIIENHNLQDLIHEISILTEEVIEVKDGKRRTVEKKLYPNYVLIKMVLTDRIWYIVRNTNGVTGFAGPSNKQPLPLSDEELMIMGLESNWEPVVDYGVGDSVKIIHGPLDGFIGTVQEILSDKKKVTVLVSMFGRDTPVDLELTQVLRL